MTIQELKNDVHNRLLELRCVERLIYTQQFEILYNRAEILKKNEVTDYINQCLKEKIEKWIDSEEKISYYEMTLRQLREVARGFAIPYYARLTKATLLSEINQYEKSKETSRIDRTRQIAV